MLNVAMSLDLIVLVLTIIGLTMSQNRSSLWQLLFRQGIIYFFVAFIANLFPAVFLVLNLNRTCILLIMGDHECHPNSFLLIYSNNERGIQRSRSGRLIHRRLSLLRLTNQLSTTSLCLSRPAPFIHICQHRRTLRP